jgi:hypothetical protein
LKPETLLLLLAFSSPAWLGAAETTLDSPQGVTLSVDAMETGILVWDPIHRDDLMGYSVWMRQDKGDFTRLKIPTLVGKEMKKLPMTTKGSLTLKGIGKRTVEIKVTAEYESGRSEPSATVFSKKARRSAGEAAAGSAAGSLSPSAKVEPQGEPEQAEDKPAPSPYKRAPRSEMAPQGKIRSSLTGGILWEQTIAKGYNSMKELGYYVVGNPGYDRDTPQNWTFTYSRQKVEVPISLEYGILSMLEIGGEISFVQERSYAGKYDFGADTFGSYNSEAAVEASGFGNPTLKARIQPSESLGLRLGFKANLSTGSRSRLQAFGEYLQDTSKIAGLDDNDMRMEIRFDIGARGEKASLQGGLGIKPAASETAYVHGPSGPPDKFRAERGQEVFGRIGYSIPWASASLPGWLDFGLTLRSIEASRWFVNDQDAGANLNKDFRTALRSFTGINLGREDQFGIFLELRQNLYSIRDRNGLVQHAVDSGGKIEYIFKPDGQIFAISGGFYY